MMEKIEGEKIILKILCEEDAEKLNEYSREPKLNEYSGPYKASKSIESAKEYISKCNEKMKKGESYHFGIYDKNDGEIVGVIGYFDLNEEGKSGEIGFWVAKDYWNKGYMSEAVKLFTKYIFEELKFHRVFAHFHELNKAVEKILQKSGYEKEGELKEALFTEGKYYDDIIYGIVNK
jgi:[ribosomal protein S5]-alanine N-acetyltransferase